MEKRLVRNVQDKKMLVFVQVLLTTQIWTKHWFVLFGFSSHCQVDQEFLLTSFFGSLCQKLGQKRKLSASL